MNISPVINQQNLAVSNVNHNNNGVRRVNNVGSGISFGSRKSEVLINALEDSIETLVSGNELNILNKMRFRRVLDKALPVIMVPENYVNCGLESKIYRISDKYVAKIQRGYYPKNAIHACSPVSLPNKKFKQLDFYYGAPIAKVGRVEILKNATPTENHVCCGTSFRCDGKISDRSAERYATEFLPLCSQLPQESFDNLARNLKIMNSIKTRDVLFREKTYVPDIVNPNNFIISDNRFVLVDELDTVPEKNPNSVYTMIDPLLVKLNPMKTADQDEKLTPMRQQILKKIMLATEKSELPLDGPVKHPYSEYHLMQIVGQKAFEVIDNVRNLRETGAPLSERLAEIEKTIPSS